MLARRRDFKFLSLILYISDSFVFKVPAEFGVDAKKLPDKKKNEKKLPDKYSFTYLLSLINLLSSTIN